MLYSNCLKNTNYIVNDARSNIHAHVTKQLIFTISMQNTCIMKPDINSFFKWTCCIYMNTIFLFDKTINFYHFLNSVTLRDSKQCEICTRWSYFRQRLDLQSEWKYSLAYQTENQTMHWPICIRRKKRFYSTSRSAEKISI